MLFVLLLEATPVGVLLSIGDVRSRDLNVVFMLTSAGRNAQIVAIPS